MKKLYRSRTNRIIAGVCGGLGEYFNIDPVIVRVILILMFLLEGVGLILYIIAWVIIPAAREESGEGKSNGTSENFVARGRSNLIIGIVLVLIGVVFLSRNFWFYDYMREWIDYAMKYAFPGFLVVIGIYLIFKKETDKDKKED